MGIIDDIIKIHEQKWKDLKNWLDSLCVTLINDGLIDEVNLITDVLSKMEELEKKHGN